MRTALSLTCAALTALAVALIVAACAAPETGEVVNKHYEPAYTWTSFTCGAYWSNGTCMVQIPITNHEPEHWYLRLTLDGDTGDRAVPQQAFYRCSIGATYPGCASSPQ